MFKAILLPLDLDDEPEANRLFEQASDMAKSMNARLVAMTVVPAFTMPMVASFFPEGYEEKALAHSSEALADFIAGQKESALVKEQVVGHGSIYKEIVKAAKDQNCDVIMLAPGSSESGDYLLGHNASRVMRHAHCSVVLLRS